MPIDCKGDKINFFDLFDRVAGMGAYDREIVVTPEMITAGRMYADPAFLQLKDHELAAIYRAMEAERRRKATRND